MEPDFDLTDPLMITRSTQPGRRQQQCSQTIKGSDQSNILNISAASVTLILTQLQCRPNTMALIRALPLALMALFATTVVLANDADPLQDFCIAETVTTKPQIFINGLPCKDPAKVVSEDFTFRGLRNQGNLSTSFGAPLQTAFVQQFPGINTQGISWARLDFAYPAGLNVPHWHQRATEILSCQEGELLVGFVDTSNKLWSTVLKKGDITTFPRGLMHFQLNVGTGPAYAMLALNSQNPGRSDVGASTFGAGVKEQILEKAFGLSEASVKALENFFEEPHVQESSGREVM